MTTYYAMDASGVIRLFGGEPFGDGVKALYPADWHWLETDETIVYGYDGNPYPASQLPAVPRETLYMRERAAVALKYEAPWNGTSGGLLTVIRMTMSAAMLRPEPDPDELAAIRKEYNAALAAQYAEYDAIDQKYGVE